jgi:putative mRNA 3-end processing factor
MRRSVTGLRSPADGYCARHAQCGWDRFVLSDHADWPGLLSAIAGTGAQRVIVTHGSVPVMVRYLAERGLQAEAFDTEYGGDAVEADVEADVEAPAAP